LITNSPHLTSFINTILNDYRYLLNKKEIYDFVQEIFPSYIHNLKTSPTKTTPNTTPSTNGPVSVKPSFLISLKAYIERCCQTINEIRFYFEFQQLSKHLKKLAYLNGGAPSLSSTEFEATTATTSVSNKAALTSESIPSITSNIDFKSSQILGSIKAIYLLISSNQTPSTSHQQTSTDLPLTESSTTITEEYNLIKFKLELKAFLVEIIDYLRVQMAEMNSFLTDQTIVSLTTDLNHDLKSEEEEEEEENKRTRKDIKNTGLSECQK